MGRGFTTFASVVFSAVLASNLVFAAATEKDGRPVNAKAKSSPVSSTATPSPSSGTKKGDTAPITSPTPQASQPVEAVIPQTPIVADPSIQSLSSPAAGEQIKWQVISGGGSQGSSGSYKLGSTIGQTATGMASSASYKLNAGFWQNFSTSCCVKEGDCNHSTSVNVVDITFLVAHLFQGGPAPVCAEECDVTDSGTLNVVDLTTIVAFLFKGGSVGVCP